MKRLCIILTAILLVGSIVEKAQAFYVIDTGNNSPDGVLINGNYGVAMQFSLGQSHAITSIESMIANSQGGTLSLAVFSDNANLPNYADELFRQDVFIPAITPGTYDWYGITGMNLNLNTGPYWVTWDSFSNPFTGTIVGRAVNPLDRYLFVFLDPSVDPTAYTEIGGAPSTNLTLRIGALDEENPTVPEPATILLFGTGLVGAYAKRRNQGNQQSGEQSGGRVTNP